MVFDMSFHHYLILVSLWRGLSSLWNGFWYVTSKLRITDLCAGNSLVIDEFPAQKTSNAENVSIWCRHHEQQRCEDIMEHLLWSSHAKCPMPGVITKNLRYLYYTRSVSFIAKRVVINVKWFLICPFIIIWYWIWKLVSQRNYASFTGLGVISNGRIISNDLTITRILS